MTTMKVGTEDRFDSDSGPSPADLIPHPTSDSSPDGPWRDPRGPTTSDKPGHDRLNRDSKPTPSQEEVRRPISLNPLTQCPLYG